MYNEVLTERVCRLKETLEGVAYVCREMDKFYKAGVELWEE